MVELCVMFGNDVLFTCSLTPYHEDGPNASPNFRDITSREAKFNVALCLIYFPRSGSEENNSLPRVGIEPRAVVFTYSCCAAWPYKEIKL